jgi:hypothetical protein
MKAVLPSILAVLVFSSLCLPKQLESKQSTRGTVVAVVLGREIQRKDLDPPTKIIEQNRARMNQAQFDQWLEGHRKNRFTGLIIGRLLGKYTRDNGLEPTKEEIRVFTEKTREREIENRRQWEEDRAALLKQNQSEQLSEKEKEKVKSRLKTIEKILKADHEMKKYKEENRKEARRMEENIAKRFVQSWKVNKSLYDRYGGRVIFQQAGPEPIDAYRIFLEEQQKKGSFKIMDEELGTSFWTYFINDRMHTFYPDKEGARFINTPWWLAEEKSN